MENSTHSSGERITGNCSSFGEAKFPSFVPSVKKICEQVQDYTSAIQLEALKMLFESKSSCIYLYYWLYYTYGNEQNIEYVKDLYEALIKADDTSHQELCPQSGYNTITDDEMTNLKDIHIMYAKLKNVTVSKKCECLKECAKIYKTHVQTCKYNSNTYFCKELLNIKEQYDEQMISENCGTEIPKTLPSFENYNVTTLTLIPIFVTLAISSCLFILYKFMPYGSSFRCGAIKKRKQYYNIDNERNILELSETLSCDFRNNRYHILYKSY